MNLKTQSKEKKLFKIKIKGRDEEFTCKPHHLLLEIYSLSEITNGGIIEVQEITKKEE